MGAKTWMLVYAKGDPRQSLRHNTKLDREATERLATTLFPKDKLKSIGDGDLSYTCPPNDEVHAGCFGDVSVVAAKEFGIDYPSKLPARFISAAGDGTLYFHAMHSVVDWFAFAKWVNGELVRSLSLSPENGIIEDIGPRLPFEQPLWAGQNSVEVEDEEEKYPLPFHPLELGEAALEEFFGYQLEGVIRPDMVEPESIPLVKFRRGRSWWKLW